MKRTYIKPETEVLDSELLCILCTSSGTESTVNGGKVNDTTNPDPNSARESEGFFSEDDEF